MNNKKIIVGISGGIAAYKAAELVRLFIKAGADIEVAMTQNATRFVTATTFEALSGNKVISDMFQHEGPDLEHITWAQGSDLIIIAPATANIIAKIAHGIGDDFLSTLLLAATARILVCPAMNSQMYLNPAVQNNLRLLSQRGITVMDPTQGVLACKTEGPGRLPDPEDIFELASALISKQDLAGLQVMISAGPTIEPIDPVRYITNRSSGKMGYALARAARQRGATVTLISGPTNLRPPTGVSFNSVKTAEEMRQAIMKYHHACDIIIKAAAVADYKVDQIAREKIKKAGNDLTLKLIKNPDILAQLGAEKKKYKYILVGFAAETQNLLQNAQNKLIDKNLDIIVANDVSRDDAGFDTDNNKIKMIFKDGREEDSPLIPKDQVANLILDRIKGLLDKRNAG